MNEHQLQAYLNTQRRITHLAKRIGFGADAAFGGSLIALGVSIFAQSEAMLIAATTSGAISFVTAYSSTSINESGEKIMDMAENEALAKGLGTKS